MSEAGLDKQRVAAARLWGALHFPYLASALFAKGQQWRWRACL